jgi:hypothetical protein
MTKTQAEFYATIRETRGHMAASEAWHLALGWTGRAAALEGKAEDAAAALAGYRTACGMAEPKRHSVEGVELARLRTESREARTAAWKVRDAGHVPTEDGAAGALRYVGRVAPLDGGRGRRDAWDSREDCGYYTEPDSECYSDGSGLCFGVVYQLPGRGGLSRYVAGYQFGDLDGGPTLDLSKVYTARVDWHATAKEGAEESAVIRAADSMAKEAAEAERTYRTARQAGQDWTTLQGQESRLRRKALDILAERRQARGLGDFPALCGAVRANVSGILAKIAKKRARRAELVAGDCESLYFYPDDAAKAAFCDGAELDAFPA